MRTAGRITFGVLVTDISNVGFGDRSVAKFLASVPGATGLCSVRKRRAIRCPKC
jgi:hypothetical protein